MKHGINIFLIILFFSPRICFAGGAAVRRKQQIEQRKQQIEQQRQQLIQQQEEAYRQQAIQQQKAYRQQAIQQQKEAYRQRSLQQQQAVQQRQIQQQQQAYRQRVIRQQQLAAQQRAIQQQKAAAQQRANAQQKAIAQQALQRKRNLQVEVAAPRPQQNRSIPKQDEKEVKEIVTLAQIWRSMETTSEVWTLMMDTNPKVATVDKYIEWYKQRGIVIQNPPIYYVQMIDTMAQNNPSMLQNPFGEVLKKLAIIEYDFNNGRDKDLMAREILGEEAFQRNKERLGR